MSATGLATAASAGASRPIRTAAIVNLGCKVNQAEMESAARRLRERGVGLVDPAGGARPADLVVVNTCTVTAEADAKSRHAVRRARRANPDAAVVVTGCSVQVGREAFEAADPAARLVDNRHKDGLLAELEALVGDDGAAAGGLGAARVGGPLPTLSGVEIDVNVWPKHRPVNHSFRPPPSPSPDRVRHRIGLPQPRPRSACTPLIGREPAKKTTDHRADLNADVPVEH